MKEQIRNKKPALKLVAGGQQQGPARKHRRLAAAIPAPEPGRPRLPAQDDTAAIFSTEAWRDRWGGIRPVSDTLGVYVAGCSGSIRLANLLGMPVLKAGTARDVGGRMRGLNAERYGSLAIRNFTIVDEPGWDDWEAAKLSCRPTHPASPVRVLPRQLVVETPFWVTLPDIEALVVAALEPITLAQFAARPDGQALCRRRGCDKDDLLRYSRSKAGPVLATEIGVIAPSGDASRLVALLERIIIDLVMADGGER